MLSEYENGIHFSHSPASIGFDRSIALSKYYGFYREFKKKIKNYGIGWRRSNSIDSFFRIMNNANNDVTEWLDEATEVLDDNDLNLYVKLVLMSGLRKSEATSSFNLLTKLHDEEKLSHHYNEELETIEHFRYPDIFFRRTKNVFISMIPKRIIYACHSMECSMFMKLYL